MQTFKKGDHLVYRAWGFLRARVVTAHKDGSYTVEPQWWVVRNGDGWDIEGGCYQGGHTVRVTSVDIEGPYTPGPKAVAAREAAHKAALVRDAAPDMLESGKALLSFLDAYPHQWGVDIAGPQQALRAAIAKAEGRS